MAHDFKLSRERLVDPFQAMSTCHDVARERVDGFARVVEHAQKDSAFFFTHTSAEHLFDQLPQRARAVVDDVPKLGVFAVNVADDVNHACGKAELGAQSGDFGDRGFSRGKSGGECLQMGETIRRDAGHRGQSVVVTRRDCVV